MAALADLLAPDAAEPMPSGPGVLPADSTTWDIDHPGQRNRQTAANRTTAGGLAHDTYEGLDRYRAAYTGERPVEHNAEGLVADTEVQGQFNTAGNLALGGRGIAGAAPHLAKDAEGAATVFIGRKGGERLGKGMEREVAEGLYKQGYPIEDIRQQTGWSFGPRGEGDWQYEISDHDMKFKPLAWKFAGGLDDGMVNRRPTLGETIHHPEWFKAFPESADIQVDLLRGPNARPGGVFDSEDNVIRSSGMDAQEVREILGHELQHASDAYEKKPGGSNPKWTRAVIETQVLKELPPEEQAIYHALSEKEKNAIAYRRYRHDAGEVNAEITRNRLDLTPEQRLERAPRMDLPKDIDPDLITLGRASAGYGGPVKAEMAIKGYHGSPHDFDQFSMDKIGTGEGAQAYGHGLYFAENEDVAKSYRDALAPQSGSMKVRKYALDDPMAQKVAALIDNEFGPLSYDETVKRMGDTATRLAEQGSQGKAAELLDAQYWLIENQDKFDTTHGRMYEVEIDAQPEQFLDWDKPVNEQPHVLEALHGAGYQVPKKPVTPEDLDNLRAKYGEWGEMQAAALEDFRSKSGAEFAPKKPEDAAALRKAGVPGVRYLDGSSRGAGDGSRNYVTFSDDIVKILRKYGVAGLAMLPPAVQATLLDGGQEKP